VVDCSYGTGDAGDKLKFYPLKALDLLEALAPEIRETRKWAGNAAYGRSTRGDAPRRTHRNGKSDPTGSVATGKSQEELREAIRYLDRELLVGVKSIVRAYDRVNKAFNRTDPRHEIARDRFPSEPVSEVRKAQAAKARRDERGEGYGVS
jgi:hypothetical protein